MEREGWVARSSVAEVARWIASQAFVESRYRPLDLVRALCMLGLVEGSLAGDEAPIDCTKLTAAACTSALAALRGPACSCFPAGTAAKVVSIYPLGKSAFIGKRGSGICRVRCELRKKLADLAARGSVSLRVHTNTVVITAELAALPAGTSSQVILDALGGVVRADVRWRVQKRYGERKHRQQCRQEQGRQYHQELRIQRILRRELPGAARALSLPERGVDGFGAVAVRRPGKPTGPVPERLLRKGAGLRRRRAWLRQKRRELLRACAAAGARGALAGGDGWREPARGTRRMRTCQRLLASAHVTGGAGSRPHALRRARGAARRLRRHLQTVSVAAGRPAPDSCDLAPPSRQGGGAAPRAPRARGGGLRGAKCCRDLAAEIADGIHAIAGHF